MPKRNDPSKRHAQSRHSVGRRVLLALLVVPAGGCSTSPVGLNAHRPAMPFVFRFPWAGQAKPGTAAEEPEVVYRQAAFRMQNESDSAALIEQVEGLLDPARGRVENSIVSAPPPMQPDSGEQGKVQRDQFLSDPPAEPADPLAFVERDNGETSPPLPQGQATDSSPPLPLSVQQSPRAGEGSVSVAAEALVAETPLRIVETPQVIDLASALGMAGANAWTIQLARQRTVEAHADVTQARALWLPSLQFGVGWNKHDGRLQETQGQVLEASRGSLFVGGGSTLGIAPIAGGSNGPLRLSADLALADAFFASKIASRSLAASRANVNVARNKALLDAGLAYIALLEAAGQVADAGAAISAAGELLQLTRTFEEAGAGAMADVDRAATEQARLARNLADANRLHRTRSAMLARRLRLDPRLPLQVADQVIVPFELSADTSDIDSQIATALAQRPEILEQSHQIAGLCLAVNKAHIEPWIPHVAMTTSAGSFSGGTGSNLDNQAGRSDVDLQALWQLDNLGLGVAATRSRAGSRLAQARTELADLRDQITAEVVQAYENVLNYRQQIESAAQGLALAEASYERNLQRIKADEGLPIELLQAINARAAALSDRTTAVSNYNRAQLELLYATGQLRP